MGLDIGTTTTQMILSRLEVSNQAGPGVIAHYGFSRRDVVFMSEVIFTPFDPHGQIDTDGIERFVTEQCARAGQPVETIGNGAIIVTGETAKVANAREALEALSLRLGDFVVATAGPNLESVIAGHGSGAAAYSRTHAARVLNIDIGGGTSNFALFQGGRLLDTACLNVGGRLLRVDSAGRTLLLTAPAAAVVQDLWGRNATPPTWSIAQLDAYAQRLAELVLEVTQGRPSALAQALLMTPPLARTAQLDAVFISGGVGACLRSPVADGAFGDTGPRLARHLERVLTAAGVPWRVPEQTLRATVIGASAHTLSLSGSTIWLDVDQLPLRSVPVLACDLPWPAASGALSEHWLQRARLQDLDVARDRFALMLPPAVPVTYANVRALSEQVLRFLECQASRPGADPRSPVLIVTDADLGKALGNELHAALPGRPLAVIDEVHTAEGDYLDIGTSLFNGQVVPLTVKSLAFPA